MKKRARLFAGGFWVTVIAVSVMGAMLYCESSTQTVMAGQPQRLFAAGVARGSDAVSLTLLGRQYRLECGPVARLETLRRRYYYLLPAGVRLLEQAVCHTVNELNALAQTAQTQATP